MIYPQFPPNFYFGAATAAYQIEGGWNADGKGPSTWDTYAHTPGKIAHGHTGDVACNTYHDFQTDIDLMAGLSLNAYRFSVAWSRVLPQGKGPVNSKGLDYYKRLVDALLAKNITPFITLFHWDMPQALEDECGGFIGRDGAYYFADYAEQVVKSLGDRVRHWITLNEPWEHAMFGHFLGEQAPGKRSPWLYFKVAHHELLGHGLAVERIRAISPAAQVGITLSQFPSYPWRDTPQDCEAAVFADQFVNRFYLDGIYKGVYPAALLKRLWPFRPAIQAGDLEIISRPTDFLGVNYYSPIYARSLWYLPFFRAWVDRTAPKERLDPEMGDAYPQGIYELAMRYRDECGNPPVYITENGCGDDPSVVYDLASGAVHDPWRQKYLDRYMAQIVRANQAGADIRGYFVWTLMDNFEWGHGFGLRMGLIHVDHTTQKRTIKDSAFWYRDLIRNQYKYEN